MCLKWCSSLMFQETMMRIAAMTAIGTFTIHAAKRNMKRATMMPWMMPEKGVFAPDLMLVAVRAIAPVAGMPPKRTEPRLAVPWAISSVLDLWVRPVIPSATTALSSDSIAASRAMVRASGTRLLISSKSKTGRDGLGRVLGMPPKRDSIVSTGSPKRETAAAPAITATIGPGTLGK